MKIYHHVDDSPESVMDSAMTGHEVVMLDNEGKEYMSIWLPQKPLFEEGIWYERWSALKKYLEDHMENYPDEIIPVWQIAETMEEMEKK